MVLTLINHCVNLRTKLRANQRCSSPALTASLIVARHLGKGPYLAHQIREFEVHVLNHHAFQDMKSCKAWCLPDNEMVLQGVCKYLAAARLGEVTLGLFQCHLTQIIFLSLGMSDTTAISDLMCQWWLHRLGYRNLEVRKGLYVDGHERPDVIEARGRFLARM